MVTPTPLRQIVLGTALLLFLSCRPALAINPAIAELQQQVSTLQTQVSTLQTQISTLQTQNTTLQTQLTALQTAVQSLEAASGTLAAVSQYMSVETVNTHPTVRFTGANVQIVNGMGSTATANGTGNLIVGYDEADASGAYHCTGGIDPTYGALITTQIECTHSGYAWVSGFKTGSHYIVLGSQNNYSYWGGLIGGFQNTSNYGYASVSSGRGNAASNLYSSVDGGGGNVASGTSSSVSGGYRNIANGQGATVSGGTNNVASGLSSSILGGYLLDAKGDYETIPSPPTCTSNANCGSGAYCNSEGFCSPGCVSDQNCPLQYYCTASVCVPEHPPGSACTGGNQCTTGICLDGLCQTSLP